MMKSITLNELDEVLNPSDEMIVTNFIFHGDLSANIAYYHKQLFDYFGKRYATHYLNNENIKTVIKYYQKFNIDFAILTDKFYIFWDGTGFKINSDEEKSMVFVFSMITDRNVKYVNLMEAI